MTYLEGACVTHYCNDVETYGGINTEMLHVGIGGYDGPAYFLPVDGVLGLDVLRIAPMTTSLSLVATMSSSRWFFRQFRCRIAYPLRSR